MPLERQHLKIASVRDQLDVLTGLRHEARCDSRMLYSK
jgi:hypothetical protein